MYIELRIHIVDNNNNNNNTPPTLIETSILYEYELLYSCLRRTNSFSFFFIVMTGYEYEYEYFLKPKLRIP